MLRVVLLTPKIYLLTTFLKMRISWTCFELNTLQEMETRDSVGSVKSIMECQILYLEEDDHTLSRGYGMMETVLRELCPNNCGVTSLFCIYVDCIFLINTGFLQL